MDIDNGTLIAEIKENHAKLNGCARHCFDNETKPPLPFAMRLTCRNCGGNMDAVQAFRYCQGFKAAGGNPNDVMPGYE